MAERDPRYFKVYQDGDDRELELKIEEAIKNGVGGSGVDQQAREEIEEVTAALAEMPKTVNNIYPDADGNIKIEVPEVDTSKLATKTDIQQLSLTFKESYTTLTALQTAYPNGDNANHAVLVDNMIYTYKNGWISTGIQANGTGVAPKTIKPGDTTFIEVGQSLNLLSLPNNTINGLGLTVTINDGVITINGTASVALRIKLTNGYDIKEAVPAAWQNEVVDWIETGKTYIMSTAFLGGTASSNDTAQTSPTLRNKDNSIALSRAMGGVNFTTQPAYLQLYIGVGITYNNYKIGMQIEEGTTAHPFEPFSEGKEPVLKGISLEEGSVKLETLDEPLREMIGNNSPIVTKNITGASFEFTQTKELLDMSADSGNLIGKTTDQIYTLFDDLATKHSRYIKRNLVGYGGDKSGNTDNTKPIYEYIISPYYGSEASGLNQDLPTILLVSGVHGNEKVSVWGVYQLLLQMFEGNKGFTQIKTNCILKIIPVLNRHGFDNNIRENAFGHDINRTFTDLRSVESRVLSEWLNANKNSFAYTDYHNTANVNWYTYFTSFNQDLKNVYSSIIRTEAILWQDKYKFDVWLQEEIQERFKFVVNPAEGSSSWYTYTQMNMLNSATLEIGNYDPKTMVPYTKTVVETATELLGNWLLSLLRIHYA